jgi:hypothetical protein
LMAASFCIVSLMVRDFLFLVIKHEISSEDRSFCRSSGCCIHEV